MDQVKELIETPDTGPVVMLNLLKFKARADGADSGETGAAAYGRYGDSVVKMVESRGGKVLWIGKAEQVLIGDPTQDWDVVVLVEYPSRAAFIEMTSTPEYDEAHEHRSAGLERTIVVACQAQDFGAGGFLAASAVGDGAPKTGAA
jgi:uncharacterized protein (DUF1330 family)